MRRHGLSLVLCGLYGVTTLICGVLGAIGWSGFAQIAPVLPIPIFFDSLGLLSKPVGNWLLGLNVYALLALLVPLHLLVLYGLGAVLTKIGAFVVSLFRLPN